MAMAFVPASRRIRQKTNRQRPSHGKKGLGKQEVGKWHLGPASRWRPAGAERGLVNLKRCQGKLIS